MSNLPYTDSFDSNDEFWSNATSEPKRKYRFTFDVAGLPIWTITKVDRPSFEISETKHVFYNHSFYYPGRLEWKQLKFTTVDPINPDASGILMKMAKASGYQFPDKQFGGEGYNYKSLNKVDSVGAITPVTITSYGSDGREVEKWTLRNAFLRDVSMGDYDYESQDMIKMDITLRYDWATIQKLKKKTGSSRAVYQINGTGEIVPDSAIGP